MATAPSKRSRTPFTAPWPAYDHLKTPAEIDAMARAGALSPGSSSSWKSGWCPAPAPASSTLRRGLHPRTTTAPSPAFKGLYGFPATDLRVRQPRGRPRDPEPVPPAHGRRHRQRRRGRRARRLVRRLRPHPPRGRHRRRDPPDLLDVTREALRPRHRAGPDRQPHRRHRPRHPGPRRAAGFSVVRELVGHGIGREPHEDPQVPNFGSPGQGPRIEEGLVIAIEPMVNAGVNDVRTLPDRWTVITADRPPERPLRAHGGRNRERAADTDVRRLSPTHRAKTYNAQASASAATPPARRSRAFASAASHLRWRASALLAAQRPLLRDAVEPLRAQRAICAGEPAPSWPRSGPSCEAQPSPPAEARGLGAGKFGGPARPVGLPSARG
jgi:hypothetical protein